MQQNVFAGHEIVACELLDFPLSINHRKALAKQIATTFCSREIQLNQLRFVFLNSPFDCQNVSVCLKLNKPRLAIVYYTTTMPFVS